MTSSDNALKEISKTLLSIDKSLKTIAGCCKQQNVTPNYYNYYNERVYGPYGHGTGDIATADTQNINFS